MNELRDKIYATIAATRVASAMGAAVECWSVDKIEQTYGVLEELVEYEHYGNGWRRMPGTTEDGIERQKLMCAAIARKGGRITAQDLVATWLEVLDPEKMKFMTEKFDRDLLAMARSGLVPARELGAFCPHFHINTTGRSFHAIPLINAGDMDGMMQDLVEIGGVYQHHNSLAFPWGRVYNAAMVAALEPGATVDDILQAGMGFATDSIRRDLDRVLEIADRHPDALAMRREVNRLYDSRSGSYPLSWIDENVCKSFAVLRKCGGDVRAAIVGGVNFGRDTDCTAASAAGLAAAMAGSGSIPAEWVEQVDRATAANPHTNSHLTVQETADAMWEALGSKVAGAKAYASTMTARIR